jgi:hypothetical protein
LQNKLKVYWKETIKKGNIKQIPPHSSVRYKGKVFSVVHHAIKTYWGIGGIAPPVLNIGTRQ